MAFLEVIGLAIIVLLIIILIKLYKKEELKKEENGLANSLLLKQLLSIEKNMDSKAKEDTERQQKIMKCVKENIASYSRIL